MFSNPHTLPCLVLFGAWEKFLPMLPRDDPPIRQGFPVLWLVTAVHYSDMFWSLWSHCWKLQHRWAAGSSVGCFFFSNFLFGASLIHQRCHLSVSHLCIFLCLGGSEPWFEIRMQHAQEQFQQIQRFESSRLRIGVATFYHIPSTTSTGNHWHSH